MNDESYQQGQMDLMREIDKVLETITQNNIGFKLINFEFVKKEIRKTFRKQ